MTFGVVMDLAWDGDPDRRVHATAYLLEALAARGPAFGVNPLWMAYFRRFPGALKRHWRPQSGILHNVVTIAAPPSAEHARALGRTLAGRLRNQAGWLLWSDPDWVDALDFLPGWRHVYWCTDDRVAARPQRATEVAERERRMCERAEAVFAVSRTLADRLPGCRVLPNGVDDVFFADLPAPHPELADLPEPRAVYVGYLNERVDWDVLLRLMRSSFKGGLVLVGPLRTADPRLAELLAMPRVRMLGWRGRVETRAILAGCTVGLVPYVDDAFNRACHPLKFYEYAGCGLRVVTTPLPEAAHANIPLTVASPAEFAYAVLASHGRLPDADRLRVLRENAWSGRADALCEMLEPSPACT